MNSKIVYAEGIVCYRDYVFQVSELQPMYVKPTRKE